MVQTLLEVGTRVFGGERGALDRSAQLGMRVAEMFGLTIRQAHALVLIDASAKPTRTDPVARRLDQLQFALIVQLQKGGAGNEQADAEPFLRIIQKAVNEQTDQTSAALETRRSEGCTYQELRDTRLPTWATVAWGQIDGYFVLTVGEGVWPMIARVAAGRLPALSREEWYARVRGRPPATTLVEVFLAIDNLRRRLDPCVDGRVGAFLRAWELDEVRRAYWVAGFEGRALNCRGCFASAAETVTRVYADAGFRQSSLLRTVPAEARYAVFDLPAERFLPSLFNSLLAIQGVRTRANIDRTWNEIQAEQGFDVERDLLSHLGRHVVVHNDPPHPLRLPLAATALIEIGDDPTLVRTTVDRMCAGFRAALERAAARSGNPPPFTLHRDEDGVWYLRLMSRGSSWLGLAGPALVVTDRFIIVSWSPLALREYLDKVGPTVRGPHR